MPRCRFVAPDSDRYELSDGDWIRLKRQLTAGERWGIDAAGVTELEDGKYQRDMAKRSVAIRLGWLASWSFVDEAGNQTKPTEETLTALDLPTIAEIDEAIIAHRKAQEAGKNGQSLGSDKA
jgi:hypothetical protein